MAKPMKQMGIEEDEGKVAEPTPQIKAPRPNMTDFEYSMWLATRNHMGGRAADVKGNAVTYVISW